MNVSQQNLNSRLRQYLRDSSLRPGDRLPSERELAAHLNVGRTVLRPILDALEEEGILIRRPQAGTFLAAIPAPHARGAVIAVIAPFNGAPGASPDADSGWLHRIVAAFERFTTSAGAALIVLDQSPTSNDPCSIKTLALRAADSGARAAVLMHPAGSKHVIAHAMAMLHDRNVHPVIVSARNYSGFPSQVYFDSAWGSYLATRHLLGRGHQAIAFAGAASGHEWVQERLVAYQEALAAAEIEPDPAWTFLADGGERLPEARDGADAFEAFWSLPADRRPTAVVAANDVVALGLIDAAQKRDVSVPGDLSVVGFDNDPESLLAGLTTIDRPTETLGEAAAQVTLERVAAATEAASVTHRLRPVLIERRTVGLPRR